MMHELDPSCAELEAQVARLTPSQDGQAGALYEKLGSAYFSAGHYKIAIRALLRALDGSLSSRERALRYLVLCLLEEGRSQDALAASLVYEEAFGAFPGGLTSARLRDLDEEVRFMRSRIHPC